MAKVAGRSVDAGRGMPSPPFAALGRPRRAIPPRGAPKTDTMQLPIEVSGWTCSGELRQGPDPYFLGACDRADGAAHLRFFGGP